jgi:hypothetical protein
VAKSRCRSRSRTVPDQFFNPFSGTYPLEPTKGSK